MKLLEHPNVVALRHCFFSTTEKDELYLNLVSTRDLAWQGSLGEGHATCCTAGWWYANAVAGILEKGSLTTW